MKPWRETLGMAAMLLGPLFASDALAAHGGSRSGGHGGGHRSVSVANFSGHSGHFVGRSFHAPIGFVPRRVIYATPIAYFPSAYSYYPPPPAYYDPLSAYGPAQAPVYYEPPVQGSLPPGASYPPPPARNAPLSNYEPSDSPIYFCKDGSGNTIVTNRKENTAGKNCSDRPGENARFPGGVYRTVPNTGSAPMSRKGPYAAQDALNYRFYCPDTRKYYPEVNECTLPWLKVVPEGTAARR